jgi:hypothetical protein
MESPSLASRAGWCCGLLYGRGRRIARLIDWRFVAATVGHGLLALLVLTYCAGEQSGRWLHRLNDLLASHWRRLWVSETTSRTTLVVPVSDPAAPAAPATPPAPPAVWPLFDVALALDSLPVRQLRPIAGIRSKSHRKLALIAYCLAA